MCSDGCLHVGVLRAMSVRRSVASPVSRDIAPFIPRSRLVGCGVTGWLDSVEPLCGAVNYDTPPLIF